MYLLPYWKEGTITLSSDTFLPLTSFERNSFSRKDPFLSSSVQTFEEACIYKKVSGSSVAFLILYVDDILLIGNDMEILDSMKGYLNKSFSKQDLGEAAYTLSIKIYIDRSRRLIRFFNEYIP